MGLHVIKAIIINKKIWTFDIVDNFHYLKIK